MRTCSPTRSILTPFILCIVALVGPIRAAAQNFDSVQELLTFKNPDGSIGFEVTANTMPGRVQLLVVEKSLEPTTTQHLRNTIRDIQSFHKEPTFSNIRALDLRELIQNAGHGSIRAKLALLTWRRLIYNQTKIPIPAAEEAAFQKALIDSRTFEKKQKKLGDLRKEKLKALDTSPEQIDDLIASNNRTDVIALYRAYLPWEDMDWVETQYWENWLDSLKGDTKETVLLFRGLEKGQVKLTPEGKPYFLVPFIIHNQGTFNRRLRSLSTFNGKALKQWTNHEPTLKAAGLTKIEVENLIKAAGLTTKLMSHAINPAASPFLSWTQGTHKAVRFSKNGTAAAIRVSKQTMIPNFVSPFPSEYEWLSGIVFPDQVIFHGPSNGIIEIAVKENNPAQIMTDFPNEIWVDGQNHFEWPLKADTPAHDFFINEAKARMQTLLFPTQCEKQLEKSL